MNDEIEDSIARTPIGSVERGFLEAINANRDSLREGGIALESF